MRMLARVEGMPLESLQEGVPWNWRTTAEYLDAIDPLLASTPATRSDTRPYDGWSWARRVHRARGHRPDELAAMADLLRAGLAAGAMGFSSTWSPPTTTPTADMVPSRMHHRRRAHRPLLGARRLPRHGPRVPARNRPANDEEWAVELLTDMSLAAGGRQLNWNVMQVTAWERRRVPAEVGGGNPMPPSGAPRVVALTVPHAHRSPRSRSPAASCWMPSRAGKRSCSFPARRRSGSWPTPNSAGDWTTWLRATSPAPAARQLGGAHHLRHRRPGERPFRRSHGGTHRRRAGLRARSTPCSTLPSPTTC